MEEITAITAQRLKELRNARGLTFPELSTTLKEKYNIDISRESLSNYEVTDPYHTKYGKNEGMAVKYLRCLADFYGVSTDYLLGRTDVKQLDHDIRSVCEYTGLSEKAVSLLHTLQTGIQISKNENIIPNPDSLHMLNYLLSDFRFVGILNRLFELGEFAPKLIGYTLPLLNPEDIMAVPDGYHLIEDPTYYSFLRYELSTSFERIVDHFISNLMPDTAKAALAEYRRRKDD